MASFTILGSNGVLGRLLCEDLKAEGHEVTGLTRSDLNILDNTEVSAFVNKLDDTTVLNCIAYMPADKCEDNIDESQRINLDFVEILASHISKTRDVSLVQFSSDFIFDGHTNQPYTETDEANPLNVYGHQKKASEEVVLNLLKEKGKVIRFASLVGRSKERKTFLEKIIDRAKNSPEVSVVSDLKISTATSSLISKTVMALPRIDRSLIHVVHDGVTSWYELAQAALNELSMDVTIRSVSSETFPTVAQRPMFSALQPSPEVKDLDSRNWEQAVRSYVATHLK